MKNLPLFVSFIVLILPVGCHQQKNKVMETESVQSDATKKMITFADFKQIEGVDNVQEVPFQLFMTLDSIHLL